jgi:hypothetical protein
MITTTSNDDAHGNDDMHWRLVDSGKLNNGKQHKHGATNASSGGGPKEKKSSENDDGGFKATVTSDTVEVNFMNEPVKQSSFNLCT